MKIIVIALVLLKSMLVINPPIDIEKILKSGDGKSIETAYKVHSINEEYELLRFLKIKPIMQKLSIKNDHFYDAIITKTNTIYFEIIKKTNNINPPVVI